ncbi:DUF2125 domain-containing protein [Blastochloris viridis]|uniref:DUF2125 domain-containing protein n=1 Tax=Blastochloris viridis TaxID=1079 RepID=A0A0H5B968_BLAVI|nr:DUF2125 domain-containing protein [Blastochloris viridis]ALK07977.1 hypothetical protein BVIR_161 [Blastochloris viridis]BAR98767.1 hypothetical protein BV133_1174 [Blastochloris viridis]CUU43899.1 hypothetical protein BVIRIDIS_29270 [Blastochloris viridis]
MPSPLSSRRFWLLVAPFVLLVLLAVGWSALWSHARDRVEAEIDRAMARESGAGRQIACAERTVAGFPFRIELRCERPLFAQNRGLALEIAGSRIVAVAEVWQPQRVRFELTGPVRVAEPGPGGREIAVAEFAAAHADVVYDFDGRHQLTAVAADVTLRVADAAQPFRSPRAELLLHRQDAGTALDVTLSVNRLDGPLALPGVRGAIDLDAEARVSGIEAIRGASQAERLRSWAIAGGKADITRLRVISDGVASDASGTLALDPHGRINGALRVLVHGVDQVMADLVQRRALPREILTLVPTLAAISQRGDIAGRPAMSLPIAFREGLIRVGPLPVGAIPPLF